MAVVFTCSAVRSLCACAIISYPTMNLRTVADLKRGGKYNAWSCQWLLSSLSDSPVGAPVQTIHSKTK